MCVLYALIIIILVWSGMIWYRCIRLNYYPPPPDISSPEIGILPHADGDFATFLLTDDQPGLSLLQTDQEWMHIHSLPKGEKEFGMLVNSGNVLARLSNGTWPSTMHTAVSVYIYIYIYLNHFAIFV